MPRRALSLIAILACAGLVHGAEAAPTVADAPSQQTSKKKGEAPVVVPQPAAPELPETFGGTTTSEQVAAHALIVAREQVAAGLAGKANVEQRRDFLVAAWTPALAELQKRQADIRAEREKVTKREAALAAERAEREAKVQALEADYANRLELERLRTAGVEPE